MSQVIGLYKNRVLIEKFSALEDFTTDPIEFNYTNWTFSITPIEDQVDGSPTYTIQASSDKKKWYDYYEKFTGVSIDDAIEERNTEFTFLYFRVKYIATGVTRGLISFFLTDRDG